MVRGMDRGGMMNWGHYINQSTVLSQRGPFPQIRVSPPPFTLFQHPFYGFVAICLEVVIF